MVTEVYILKVMWMLLILGTTAPTIVSSLPISNNLQGPRTPLSSFPSSQDPSIISYPEKSSNFLVEKAFEKLNSEFSLQNILRNPIIFDEDNDEPLVPEPVFEMRNSAPSTPGTPSNQRNRIIEIVPNQRKPSNKSTTPRPKTQSPSNRPSSKSTTPQPLRKVITLVTTKKTSTTPKPSFPTTTTIRITAIKPDAIKTSEPSKPSCEESQEGDCDEILVEGSFYTPFQVQPPVAIRHRHHRRNQSFRTFAQQG